MKKKTLMAMFAVLALFAGNAFAQEEVQEQGGLSRPPEMKIAGDEPTEAEIEQFQDEQKKFMEALRERATEQRLKKTGSFSPVKGAKSLLKYSKGLIGEIKEAPERIKEDIDRVKAATNKNDKVIASAVLMTNVVRFVNRFEAILSIVRLYLIPDSQKKLRPVLANFIKQIDETGDIMKSLISVIPSAIDPVKLSAKDVKKINDLIKKRIG